ncbi:MAG: YceI family protein [Acidobacteria bacterium]|nr:YceI family protein [Acidobacteriota bacterium]
MNRSLFRWIALAAVAVAGAGLAYVFLAGGSGEPSTDLTTPTIASEATLGSEDDPASTASSGSVGAVVFVIDASQSEASFQIDEVLRGSPNTVVGTTSEVAGQIRFDPADLSTLEFSQVVINARTFDTGSRLRDRAIRGPIILNSAQDEFELIILTSASANGLDGQANPGDALSFTVTGDLTIQSTTKSVTFDVVAELVDTQTIRGTAEAIVSRAEFGIGIPNVPIVADVGDDVLIRLDFVAISG